MTTQDYPSLELTDIYAAIAYALRHQVEVESCLKERKTLAQAVRQQNEARWPNRGLRARLLGRLEL